MARFLEVMPVKVEDRDRWWRWDMRWESVLRYGGYALVELHVHTCSGGEEGSVRWSSDGAGGGRGPGGHFGQSGGKG